MSVIFIALPIALLLAGSAVLAFIWAVKGGQFDDLDSPAVRVAVEGDEDEVVAPATNVLHTPNVPASPPTRA